MIPFMKVLPALTPQVISKAIGGIATMAAESGVTCVYEAAIGAIAGIQEVDLLHQTFAQGYTGYVRQNYLGRDTRGVANFTPRSAEGQLRGNRSGGLADHVPRRRLGRLACDG